MPLFNLNKKCLQKTVKFESFPELTRFTNIFKILEKLGSYE